MSKEKFTIEQVNRLAVGTKYIVAGLLYCMENSDGKAEQLEADLPMWADLSSSIENDHLWKGDKHSGDCTKEAHTCNRCVYEEYLRRAEDLLDVATDMWVSKIQELSNCR